MKDISDRVLQLSSSKRALLESRLSDSLLAKFARPHTSSNVSAIPPDSKENLSRADEIDTEYPETIHAADENTPLADWIVDNKTWVVQKVLESGALLFRGFVIRGAEAFERSIASAWGDTTTYPGFAQSVTVRKHVSGKIYTSTEYSADFVINLHNECAFANSWPAHICFFCVEAPTEGGQTPIADTRRVLRRISNETIDHLRKLGIAYIRNFGVEPSRSWENAFSTKDKTEVEEACRIDDISCEWLGEGKLRTRAIRPPVEEHPITHEPVWFNHIHASHISSLERELRDALLSQYGREELPRNCYYGDGSEFEDHVIQEIREAYKAETVTFDWRPGDVLMLDNMLTAHGRRPFKGQRKVLVGMSGSIKRSVT
jgi:alpha-ketoglutarate-dependent taurine dioxygenase